MSVLYQYESLFVELLLVATLIAIVVRRLRIPYTVALVVVGAFLATQSTEGVKLPPDIILMVLLPPLLFEAAFHLRFSEVHRDTLSLGLMAVLGVVLTAGLVGGGLVLFTPLSGPIALLFGALIAATDPVSVVALFRALRVPKRLGMLVEAESLLNDGTAVVLYGVFLTFCLTGRLSAVEGILTFLKVALGGIVAGALLGWIASQIIARIDDYLIETALTAVLAYGSYLVADGLGVSGVLAVVTAGLLVGNLGPAGMSPTTRIVLFNFWEFAAFLANSFVFLLIGLDISVPLLRLSWQYVLVAIPLVLIARFAVVFGCEGIANLLGARIPVRWQLVMSWGGLRGAIALALALSLPEALGSSRVILQAMAFGVVLFTLLFQGTTMRLALGMLKVIIRKPEEAEYEKAYARLMSYRIAATHLEGMYQQGFISSPAWEQLRPRLLDQGEALSRPVRDLLRTSPSLGSEEIRSANREFLRSQRGALEQLARDGQLSREAFEELSAELDAALDPVAGDSTLGPAPQASETSE